MKPFNEFELYSVLLFIVLKIHLTQVERFYPSEVVCEKKNIFTSTYELFMWRNSADKLLFEHISSTLQAPRT